MAEALVEWNVRLPPDLIEALEREAQRSNRARVAVLREILRKWIEEASRREGQGGLTTRELVGRLLDQERAYYDYAEDLAQEVQGAVAEWMWQLDRCQCGIAVHRPDVAHAR